MAVSVGESMPSSASVWLDATALSRLRELDPDGRAGVVQRVLRTYERSLVQALAALNAAQAGGKLSEIRHVTHTLKSSSASVGALGLAALCAQAEAMARDSRDVELRDVILLIESQGQQVLASVRAMLRP